MNAPVNGKINISDFHSVFEKNLRQLSWAGTSSWEREALITTMMT